MIFFSTLDGEFWSVAYLGLCFTAIFSSNFIVTNMQKIFSSSIANEDPSYTVDGYVSVGLTYSVFGIFLWFAPSVISLTGPKKGLFLGCAGYTIQVLCLLPEKVWTTYLSMIVGGIGGSLLWVAEGNYMISTSSPKYLPRNIGVFWMLFSLSFITGNSYAALQFEGKEILDFKTRQTLLYVLSGLVFLALAMLLFLPTNKSNKICQDNTQQDLTAWEALVKTWVLASQRRTLILFLAFLYVGFQQSFGQGIYPSCIGFTKVLGNKAKQMAPISGILYGVGDSIGGILQIVFKKRLSSIKYSSSFIYCGGFIGQLIAFVVIFLFISNLAVFGESEEPAILSPSIPLILVSSFLIGFGDSCFNTQVYSLIAHLEPNFSSQMCALFKFIKISLLILIGEFKIALLIFWSFLYLLMKPDTNEELAYSSVLTQTHLLEVDMH